jgi:hypothetical protein
VRVNAQSAPRLAAYYARIFPGQNLEAKIDPWGKLRVPLTIVGILATRPYLITPRALAPHN